MRWPCCIVTRVWKPIAGHTLDCASDTGARHHQKKTRSLLPRARCAPARRNTSSREWKPWTWVGRSGLLSACSETPFSFHVDNGDRDASGSSQIADCLGEPNYVKTGANRVWIDADAFVQPSGLRFGTCGPNSERGPGLFNLDLGVIRKFQSTEKMELQFRAKGFNMTNTPHFGLPRQDSVRD